MLPVYIAVTLSLSVFLQNVLPDDAVHLPLGRIQYADKENPWIVVRLSFRALIVPIRFQIVNFGAPLFSTKDFCRETFVTAVFTVGILVLPVLLQLNHLPRWALLWLFFPVFNYAVDATGTASTLCPNVLVTFGILGQFTSGMRIVCSLLGGMIGGKFMQVYFPDNPAVTGDSR